jgi:CSLREA domain-containing protein
LALPGAAAAATIDVDVTNDELNADGDCSLREAVQAANTNEPVSGCAKGQAGALDAIVLDFNGDYPLTLATTDEDLNANGDLDYTGGGPLTIVGQGSQGLSATAIVTDQPDRVINAVGAPGKLTLRKLATYDGDVTSLSSSEYYGGNIRVQGSGSLVLRNATVNGGQARLGGGVSFTSSGALEITKSQISANQAVHSGGLYTLGDGEATIHDSTFFLNTAIGGASRAGAIYPGIDKTTITDSSIISNTTSGAAGGSALGAGIYTASEPGLVIRRSLIAGNSAEETSESAGAGAGGVEGRAKIVNSTFYDNSTDDSGGAFKGSGSLVHVTFLANHADEGGDHVESRGGTLNLRNSILPGAQIAVDLCFDPLGEIVSKGFNVATYPDPECGFIASDRDSVGGTELDPEPADNGGLTETIAIAATSPAKNVIGKRKCRVAGGEDQRGFQRPKGKKCDAGAFERGAQP